MKWLMRLGINRGLLGGSRLFATLGAIAGGFRLLQRAAGTAPKTIYTHELQRGQALVITDSTQQQQR